MHFLLQELRQSVRALLKRPAYLLIAVLTLGLCISFNAAIFSFLNALILRPFPFREPEQIVRLRATNTERGWPRANLSALDLLDLRREGGSFENVTGASTRSATLLLGNSEPERIRVASTFGTFFPLLGVNAALGRTYLPEEEPVGKGRLAVLSDAFWRQRFGADPQAIGKTLNLDGDLYTILGVMPARFEHPLRSTTGEPAIWTPFQEDLSEEPRDNHWLQAVARVRPGVSLDAAQAELETFSARLEKEYPESNKGWSMYLQPLGVSETREIRPALYLLVATVAAVLLIACFNLAGLELARGLKRQKELALRTALGAGRKRLVVRLLIDSLVVATLGGTLGLLAASPLIRVLAGLGPKGFPRLDQVGVDGQVVLFTLLLTLLTGLLFGSIPAIRASRVDVQSILKEGGGQGSTDGARQNRLRSGLVGAQLAFSVILLVVGGLLSRSFAHLARVDPGLDPNHVVSFSVTVPKMAAPDPQVASLRMLEVIDRLRSVGGVTSIGAINMLPFTSRYSCVLLQVAERPAPPEGEEPCAHYGSVTGDYFRTLGIRLLNGRLLTPADDTQAVVVINRTMAERIWPGTSPLGKRFRWGGAEEARPWRTVVGVVSDVRHRGLDEDPMPEAYGPYQQDDLEGAPPRTMVIVARTANEPGPVIPSLRGAVWAIDRKLPIEDVQLMTERVENSLQLRRIGTIATAAFSSVGLLLAILGLAGVISFLVQQRRNEFGIRMALGASPRDIHRMVLRQGMTLTGIGIFVGLIGALALGGVLRRLLFGVSALDPLTCVSVALVVGLIGFLASYLPARKAGRNDVLTSLRPD